MTQGEATDRHGDPFPQVPLTAGPDVLASGGGELGRLTRRFNWGATSLGPMDLWPQCMKTALGIVLASPVAMVILWGEDGIMMYNNSYAVIAAGRHPASLGAKVREAWPEIAAHNDRVLRIVLAGGSLNSATKK